MTQTHSEKTHLDMAQDAATLAYSVWRQTDFDQIDTHRDLDDEFASRLASAAYTDTVASFLDRLASKWGVRSYDDEHDDVHRIIHEYDGDNDDATAREFLRTVRNHKGLVVLEMKAAYQDTTESDTSSDE